MKERLIIIIVAVISGLFITTTGFLIYQSTKKVDSKQATSKDQDPKKNINVDSNKLYVKVDEPQDESLTDKRTVVVKGATNPGNTIIISTNLEDVEVLPSNDGQFSASIEIDAGANLLVTRSYSPDGSIAEDTRTITFSTDDF